MSEVAEREVFANEILSPVGYRKRLRIAEVTGFLARRGSCYDGGLMAVGRAVNGWATRIERIRLRDARECANYADQIYQQTHGAQAHPMRWVSKCWDPSDGGYRTKSSAFWRVLRSVTIGLGMADEDSRIWPSHLVWSNLYKVSPAEGGNPSDAFCEAQASGCAKLLRMEIAAYKPRRVLFLTGSAWAEHFLTEMGARVDNVQGLRHVERRGSCCLDNGHEVRLVVASHPQTRPEADWCNEVLHSFGC